MIGPCDTAIKYNKTLHTFVWTTMAGYYSPLYTHYNDVCVSVYILPFYISTGAFYISITPLFVHGNWRSRGKLDVAQRVNWPLIIVARPETQFRALYMFAERRIINTKLMSFRCTCPRVGTWRVGRGGGGWIDSQKLHDEGRRWAALQRSIHVDEKWWWCQSCDVIHHHCLVH